jgi:Pectinacetylesterase
MRNLTFVVRLAPLLAFACIAACARSSSPGNGGSSTSGPGAGGSDAGAGADAGAITAPDDQWTWVDVPGSKCASGSETGFAVSPHAGATELLVYMEGGGECYDATTCWGPAPAAKNLTGYDGTTFTTQNQQLAYPALVRSSAESPFAAMSMAYIPYCTGDMHAGTKEADLAVDGGTMPTYFFGGSNLDLFIARLVPTFPGLTRVVLLGTSAGGFGTYLTFDKFVHAFGVRVDIVDDSGPPLVHKGETDNQALLSGWGFVPPASCSPCASFLDVMKSARAEQPQSRLGFLSFSWDTTIGPDFGYTATTYPPMIESLFPTSFGSDPNVQTYIVTSQSGHVVESVGALAPDYFPWMTAMLGDSPTWASAMYP